MMGLLSKKNLQRELQSLLHSDQDERLVLLRWRLHLRLLFVTILLTLAFAILGLTRQRGGDMLAGLAFSLLAYAWLRKHPRHSRRVARFMIALFAGLGVHSALQASGPDVLRGLLALSIMPIFGAMLDGLLLGGATALVAMATAAVAVAMHPHDPVRIAAALTMPLAFSLFSISLAHSWLFNRLVRLLKADGSADALASEAALQLATTLAVEVETRVQSLEQSLQQGQLSLAEAQHLQADLRATRQRLSGPLDGNLPSSKQLLEDLRSRLYQAFLALGCLIGLGLGPIFYWQGLRRWDLALLVALLAAVMLAWRGKDSRAWQWRIYGFLAASLAAMGTSLALGDSDLAALVFLPFLCFFSVVLTNVTASLLVGMASLGLLFWAGATTPGSLRLIWNLGLICAALFAIGASTIPLYRGLLDEMNAERERLRANLLSYRRMVTTLFHDLANPLAVLLNLALENQEGRTQPGDLWRGGRMIHRLRAIKEGALALLEGKKVENNSMTIAELYEGLNDIFNERLSQRGLTLVLSTGKELALNKGGTLLRDSILGNLLSNAIKFAPNGGQIRFSAEEDDAGVMLRLSDSGPGYPQDTLRALALGMAPHSRPGLDGVHGNGFGLLLAQDYAAELGGRLDLSNGPEGGALAELWIAQ